MDTRGYSCEGTDLPDRCKKCSGELTQPTAGRRRQYCSDSCRQLAYVDRRVQRLAAELAGDPTE
ncbi:hypothetical protein ABT282_38435 [Streptomyces sp. NPDC000927]|uniref:hypothetical protein n=1 Tax=Streptomyces sp. NPDC000927 TaxID=3154371 RepID=UPI00332074DA